MNAGNIKLHDDLIKGVIPIMMQKSFDNKSLVKKEAEVILSSFVKYCHYDVSFVVLC